MTIGTRRFALAATVLGLFAPATGRARAGVILLSQADFFANATIVSTETFDEFASPTHFFTSKVEIDGVSYTTANTSPGNPVWTAGIHFGSVGFVSPPNDFGANALGEVRIDFGRNRSVDAFGFDFLSTAFDPRPYSFAVTEIDDATTSFVIDSGQPSVFVGFTSDRGIRSVAVANADPIVQNNYSFDNVARGAITAIPIPEPSTLTTGGIAGLLVLGYAWRRRRAA